MRLVSYSPFFKSGIISAIRSGGENCCVKLRKSKSSRFHGQQHIGRDACTAVLLCLSPMNTCLGSQVFAKPILHSDFSAPSLEREEKTRELNNWAVLLPCSQQRRPELHRELVQDVPEMGPFSKHQDGGRGFWLTLTGTWNVFLVTYSRSLGIEECG